MCKNATRRFTWNDAVDFDSGAIPVLQKNLHTLEDEDISLDISLKHITTPEDYQIFDAFRSGNMSLVLDLIDEHRGVNAVDEWGQTVLMMAVSMQRQEIVASLLNTRRPRVEVNMAKPVSN